jgi:methyltransferase (TIGR00027 family)
MQPAIEHVSDTALLVAACRARETERPDGFVRDPFAARLAGERGIVLANAFPNIGWMEFGIGLRCHFLDELLQLALADGVRTVVNLGAGLDSRPWRLDLPSDLRWIEVDFPDMLAYKAKALGGAQPHCRLERMSADLNNSAERSAALAHAGSDRALLITEGLLMYLPGATVEALAEEAKAGGAFAWWLLDISSPRLMRQVHGDLIDSINNVRDEGHLEGQEVAAAIEKHGWVEAERRTYITDGTRFAKERIARAIESGEIKRDPNAPPPEDDGSGIRLYRA